MAETQSLQEPFDPNADLDENGIDRNQLRRNLARSLEERIERNRVAATIILECRRAAESAQVRTTDPLA